MRSVPPRLACFRLGAGNGLGFLGIPALHKTPNFPIGLRKPTPAGNKRKPPVPFERRTRWAPKHSHPTRTEGNRGASVEFVQAGGFSARVGFLRGFRRSGGRTNRPSPQSPKGILGSPSPVVFAPARAAPSLTFALSAPAKVLICKNSARPEKNPHNLRRPYGFLPNRRLVPTIPRPVLPLAARPSGWPPRESGPRFFPYENFIFRRASSVAPSHPACSLDLCFAPC